MQYVQGRHVPRQRVLGPRVLSPRVLSLHVLGPRVLGEAAAGRQNNLNLVRAVAAVAVLVSHAWPMALGRGVPEPLVRLTGVSLGALAVYVFFAVSGFLIAASWDRAPQPGRFVLARSLRLVPGLAVSLAVVAWGLGPAVTARPVLDYLADPAVPGFFLGNLTLAWPVYTLPGVFEATPYGEVEGSVWTLFYEVVCYAGLLLAGLCGAFRSRRRLGAWLGAYFLLWALYAATDAHPHLRLDALHRLSLPFALGTAAYLLRDRLVLSGRGLGLAAAAVLAGAALGTGLWSGLGSGLGSGAAGPRAGQLGLALIAAGTGYAAFWAAFVPAGRIRAFNRLGDYSYGIYIYAFPLQGLAAFMATDLGLPMTPAVNMALALPMTLAFAVLSWHLVEAPALRLRHRLGRAGLARQLEWRFGWRLLPAVGDPRPLGRLRS